MTSSATERDSIVAYIFRQLIGPLDGADEELPEEPNGRYLSGILYPIRPAEPSEMENDPPEDDGEEVDEIGAQLLDSEDDDPITLAGQMRPSSAGITFVATDRAPILVSLAFGRYRGEDGVWKREQVTHELHLVPNADGECVLWPEPERLSVQARWRSNLDGYIVTVVAVNRRSQDPRRRVDPHDCLFQVGLRCSPAEGSIARYPRRSRQHHDDEAEEVELQYRNVPIFALGHGVAADWDRHGITPAWIGTTYLPQHVVPDVSFEVDVDSDILSLNRLTQLHNHPEPIIRELYAFVDKYDRWVESAQLVAAATPDHLRNAAFRIVSRMETAGLRMRSGVRTLEGDRLIRRAFVLANRAMLMQMVHSREDLAGTSHGHDQAPAMPEAGTYHDPNLRWRPFQLAFLLLTIESVVDSSSADRDIVDLIWFPTGGGKTEAYLGLAAFTILHRRLTHLDDGAGTTVITRYTLRLLTTQQFQRAATMIMACERMRRDSSNELGSIPISIGVWVGGNNTPNTYAGAVRLLRNLKQGIDSTESFQIDRCPWCGTRVIPQGESDPQWGITVHNNAIRFHCVNKACSFSPYIPISSVDEDLYLHPPTLLVGTVDKFARLAWDERAGVFFGTGTHPGPSLIIQDEFHLISGPLGTMVGIYEAAFDVLMQQHGSRPKIVAATATIRRAGEQTRGVFGREVALFPPSGLDADSSYFVHTDPSKPGRKYLGVMPQGHTHVTALVHLAAALLQAPYDVPLSTEVLDGYWTLVAYHNSLRELGKTITLAHDDFRSRMEVIARTTDHVRPVDDVRELTSRMPAVEIPRILERLGRSRDSGNAVSLVAATNMISVGVDVSRLGLMVVDGQPKTTAEYIQATSRVGRNSSQRPGLVIALYSPAKPRDRSHYEAFVPYHSMLYSTVEPTSVTPFSVMARNRALHADLVVLARHVLGLSDNSAAAKFVSSDKRLSEVLEQLLDRARIADAAEATRTRDHLMELVKQWTRRVDDAISRGGLVYEGRPTQARLLKRFLESGEAWQTLDSMRSVDVEIPVRVRGAGK